MKKQLQLDTKFSWAARSLFRVQYNFIILMQLFTNAWSFCRHKICCTFWYTRITTYNAEVTFNLSLQPQQLTAWSPF